ncbi:MAG: DUF4965 domain-containing protein [Thermoguttaceae bacterium]|nr:DUF4965 domain-containing protein [Thermoguttaceae bacterium]
MSRFSHLGAFLVLIAFCANAAANDPLRAPANPLVSVDPYFSVWSNTDDLADSFPVHWTGNVKALVSFVKIDGKNYRIMGRCADMDEFAVKMNQTSRTVRATNTTYAFEDAGVLLTLNFMNPNLPDDLDAYSRPTTYLTWSVKSVDGKQHDVSIYFDATAEQCVDDVEQEVVANREETGRLDVMKLGTSEQPVLGKSGDRVRIDWGYFIVGVEKGAAQTAISSDVAGRTAFLKDGVLPEKDDADFPRKASERWPILAVKFDCGTVGDKETSKRLILAYDDIYSAEFMEERCLAYWRRDGMTTAEMLDVADEQYDDLCKRSAEFDAKLWNKAKSLGGENFASLCSLGYPQSMAAQKLLVLPNGKIACVAKENNSGGFIATVDVLYPTAPIFIAFNKELLKATLVPPLEYAACGRWPWPYAPHDLGYYPKMNGQIYGGGEKTEEKQMPVEETANMLILCDVAAKLDGNADFSKEYWKQLDSWAEYLIAKGLDPEDQLCTDDFAGRLAHNANLSVKAIVALACYADLCEYAGEKESAQKFRKTAEDFAAQWTKMAETGDHYVLTFDNPNSWSQKYNLVWDKVLDLNLFPKEVAQKEVAFYKTVMNEYGLPLDSRKEFTKVDWEVWTATLADSREDFDALMDGVYKFVNKTEPRVPMTDWYHTDSAQECNMHARSVVGGFFMKFLEEGVKKD